MGKERTDLLRGHTGLLGHACQAGTYGGSVAGAKVSVNDSETVRPVIDHLLWFHSGEQSDVRPGVLPDVFLSGRLLR